MKKIKQTIIFVLVLCFCCSIIGCGEQSKGVSKQQLEEDIKTSTLVQNCFRSNFVHESAFSYISHEIIKRQTNVEQKQDNIFCKISAENQYFTVDFEATLEYIYYDEGGWILENTEITKKEANPIAPAEKNLIIDFLFSENVSEFAYVKWYKKSAHNIPTLENGYIGEIEVQTGADDYLPSERSCYTFGEVIFDKDNLCTLLSTNYSLGDIVKTEGNFRLFFNKEQGWSFLKVVDNKIRKELPVLEINSAQFDYSKALGNFGFKYDDGKTILKYTIKEVDIENERVYFLERSNQVSNPDKMLNRDSKINLLKATMLIDERIYYASEKDCWIQPSRPFQYKSEYVRLK